MIDMYGKNVRLKYNTHTLNANIFVEDAFLIWSQLKSYEILCVKSYIVHAIRI